jgi:hypothetical protein
LDLEALLFGQAHLLEEDLQEVYYKELKGRYNYLTTKFKLNNLGVLPLKFFRLRPPNFPTVRLSQFANLYASETNIFSKIIEIKDAKSLYTFFDVGVTDFWTEHYTFKRASRNSKKNLTKSFIDLLIINTVIPLKFSYAKSIGHSIDDELFKLIRELKIENNRIVEKFLNLKPIEKTALNSQALLELKSNYCDKNKCLQCAIGNSLIIKN